MNVKLSIISCAFLFTTFLAAQGQKVELVGTIEAENMEPISLKLSFEVAEDGRVSGTTITDFYGENHTVSRIEGKLDRQSKLLSFTEMENLNTQSKAKATDFCYITVKDLAIASSDEENLVSGPFEGYYQNGKACVSGRISLQGASFLESLPVAKSTTNNSPASKAQTEATSEKAEKDEKRPRIIATRDKEKPLVSGEILRLENYSDTVELVVWDSYEEDNDRINIYLNGRLIENNLEIKERKKRFFLPVSTANTIIKIEAANEGTNPPNTVNALLIDGGIVESWVTKLKANEFISIELERNEN